MRAIFVFVAISCLCFATPAAAQITAFHAGIARLAVPTQAEAQPPFDTLVWYPAPVEETPWQIGPFTITASQNTAIATGQFPVILLSHGGGRTGGNPYLLGDLSARLARAGFIVVAPFHGKTQFLQRPQQVGAAFAAVMTDPRFKSHVAVNRTGMLGFSLGGAVALTLAGGMPNARHLAAYCATHPDDTQSCNVGPGGGNAAPTAPSPGGTALPRLPVKSLVLLDPLAMLFQRDELAAVTMPILLVRPQQSRLGEDNVRLLMTSLPQPPQLRPVAGGHFIFTDICSPALRAEAPEVCEDAAGIDRAAIHADFSAVIVDFFRNTL